MDFYSSYEPQVVLQNDQRYECLTTTPVPYAQLGDQQLQLHSWVTGPNVHTQRLSPFVGDYPTKPYSQTTASWDFALYHHEHCTPALWTTTPLDYSAILQMPPSSIHDNSLGIAPYHKASDSPPSSDQGSLHACDDHTRVTSHASLSTLLGNLGHDAGAMGQSMYLPGDLSTCPTSTSSSIKASKVEESFAISGQGPSTKVDALMQVLGEPDNRLQENNDTRSAPNGKTRKHHCPLPDCQKSFVQPTHLKIHLRSHTGEKPYRCSIPGCDNAFSQLGNLRTHERRHRGEKIQRRSRAQCGPATIEKIKQYKCRLDECKTEDEGKGKPFNQLGNLKTHMNKLHNETLARLFTQFTDSGLEDNHLSQEESDLKEYFQSLYKNCNKGIRGRGRGRRVAVVT